MPSIVGYGVVIVGFRASVQVGFQFQAYFMPPNVLVQNVYDSPLWQLQRWHRFQTMQKTAILTLPLLLVSLRIRAHECSHTHLPTYQQALTIRKSSSRVRICSLPFVLMLC